MEGGMMSDDGIVRHVDFSSHQLRKHAVGPVGDFGNAGAGDADASASEIAWADAGLRAGGADYRFERLARGVFAHLLYLDGFANRAAEDLVVVSHHAFGFRAAAVDGEIVAHDLISNMAFWEPSPSSASKLPRLAGCEIHQLNQFRSSDE
jgi:hypothetical protein